MKIFLAWPYGPALKSVYDEYGECRYTYIWKEIDKISLDKIMLDSSVDLDFIDSIIDNKFRIPASKMIVLLQKPNKAWAEYYNYNRKDIVIPKKSIANDFSAEKNNLEGKSMVLKNIVEKILNMTDEEVDKVFQEVCKDGKLNYLDTKLEWFNLSPSEKVTKDCILYLMGILTKF